MIRIPRHRPRGTPKLNPERVTLIREAHANGTSQAQLARQFGVSTTAIQKVINRETWAHVPDHPEKATHARPRILRMLTEFAPLPLTFADFEDELGIPTTTAQMALTRLVGEGVVRRETFEGRVHIWLADGSDQ